MDQTINTTQREAATFYDTIAPDYDAMTGFDKRFVQERPFFSLLVNRYGIGSAIDAGSGTGFHSILLARLGVKVTAVDVSPEMIAVLNGHARKMNLTIETRTAPLQDLGGAASKPVDAVFCLGNTLPHILTRHELEHVFAGFFAALNPHGILFLQILNYDRIMQRRERIQSIKELDGITFIRYYEYDQDSILFHLLKIRKNGDLDYSLNSVRLRPLLKDEMLTLLQEAGFSEIRLYGGISMSEYDSTSSKDLVVFALKRP